MGLLNSALQIGRSGVLSYEAALTAVGNNISGAGNPDYTRVSAELASLQGPTIGRGLQPGAGVALTDIQRNIDESLEARVRLSISAQQSAEARQSFVGQISALLDDTSGSDVGTRLNDFFHNFDQLQNTPEDSAIRDLAIASAQNLAGSLTELRSNLAGIGEDIDGQIADAAKVADGLASDIAELNGQITSAETGQRGQATALRDQRDALLRKLSELYDVSVREQPNGALNVYIGSEALVQGDVSRGLVAVSASDGTFVRTTVRFADTNQEVQSDGGRISGLIQARDQDAYGRVGSVDALAATVIREVNRIHADGQGRVPFRSLTGDVALLDPNVPLSDSSSGLPSDVSSGSFYMTVSDDATGTPVAYRINVDQSGGANDTTLSSLAEDITNRVDGVTATVTSDNRLSLQSDSGFSFVFGYDGQSARSDTSGVLAALGLNTLFSGTDASSIEVNPMLAANPSYLAAAAENQPGDGVVAGRIAQLDVATVSSDGQRSIPDEYDAIANAVAVAGNSSNSDLESAQTVMLSLQAQRESVSGVNLDEESISLVKYQRAFQGAARYLSTVNQLMNDLVSIIR